MLYFLLMNKVRVRVRVQLSNTKVCEKVRAKKILSCGCACAARENFSQPNI